MVCGKASTEYATVTDVRIRRYSFKVVRSFKYLGLHFDQRASAVHMIEQQTIKARQAFYWLLRFVTTHAWNTPHTRMVLLNVYVRSLLQFGSPVWGPHVLDTTLRAEHAALRPL
jgi:hypothetical protein